MAKSLYPLWERSRATNQCCERHEKHGPGCPGAQSSTLHTPSTPDGRTHCSYALVQTFGGCLISVQPSSATAAIANEVWRRVIETMHTTRAGIGLAHAIHSARRCSTDRAARTRAV